MLNAGTNVVASIQSIYPYGIQFTSKDATILVLITDISETPDRTRDIMSAAKVGDQLLVRIVAPYTDRLNWYAGSLKEIVQP